jgi:hypothetical protein
MPSAPNPFPPGSPAYNIRGFLNIRARHAEYSATTHAPDASSNRIVYIPRRGGRNPVPEAVLYEADLEALLQVYQILTDLLSRAFPQKEIPEEVRP